jgi:hypothetical protein
MTWVIGIEIEDDVIVLGSRDYESRYVITRWDLTEGADNFVTAKWPILPLEIGHAVWRPESLPTIRDSDPFNAFDFLCTLFAHECPLRLVYVDR